MSEAAAYTILTDRLKLAAAATDLPVAYQDVSFPDEGLESKPAEYLLVEQFNNEPSNRNVGSGRERFQGIFQITLITTEMIGVAARLETARQIAEFYDKGEVIFGTGAWIKISKKPAIASPLRDDMNLRTPISIEYEFFA